MILPGSYANGFAPRDGQPLYPELWRGCVGAWAPCLGPTGLTLRDWSGFGRHATLTNMVPASDWVVNGGYYSLDFDGGDDYAETANHIIPTGPASVSLRVYARSLSEGYFAAEWDGTFGLNMYLGVFSNNWIARSGDGSVGSSSLLSSAAVANTWTPLTVTRSVSTLTLYVNGVETASTSASSYQGGGTTSLKLCRLGLPTYANCLLQDVRVYSRALSPAEIRLMARRPSIAYEMAPRRRSSSAVQFNRRRRLLIGAG